MAEAQGRMCHRMLYLALPPSVFMPVTTNIRAALMDTEGILARMCFGILLDKYQ
jgi:glucose-6-phosphate 1-dehydrogenase